MKEITILLTDKEYEQLVAINNKMNERFSKEFDIRATASGCFTQGLDERVKLFLKEEN